MVFRGAQFQQFEPVGCRFLTRQALSVYRATFVQRRSDADCLPQGRRTTHRRLMHSHGRDQCWQPHKGLASHSARGVTSVMDLLGNRHWPGIFTGLKNRQPSIGELHDGVALARSLWHETVGFGGVGVPISTRWMI
jgi:hypothetical protein